MEMSCFVCLLVLSPLTNDKLPLTAWQGSLRYYRCYCFCGTNVLSRKGKSTKVVSLTLLFWWCGGSDPLHAFSSLLGHSRQPLPETNCSGAASSFLPSALRGAEVLQLTSVPHSWKSRQECLLSFGLGLAWMSVLVLGTHHARKPKAPEVASFYF